MLTGPHRRSLAAVERLAEAAIDEDARADASAAADARLAPERGFDKTVCVVGLGYIGLPLATVIAEAGVATYAYDIDPDRVEAVRAGRCPIEEPGLATRLASAVEHGGLAAGGGPISADYYIITVPTPTLADRSPDMRYVEAAIESIAPHLHAGSVVVIESTSPVGTTERARDQAAAARPDLFGDDPAAEPHFVYCPERIIPGDMLRELAENDRTMGGLTPEGAAAGKRLYETFCVGEIVLTHARVAEMVKLAENAFRDVNIAFANELSMVCDAAAVDVGEVISIANRHPRVQVLKPGVGVGGHCIAVDPWFLISAWPRQARLMAAARAVNVEKTAFVLERIRAAIAAAPADVRIACLGLAYKPNVGDLRESPSMAIAEALNRELPGRVTVCEPHLEAKDAPMLARKGLRAVSLEAVEPCALLVELTPHAAFRPLLERASAARALRFQT